MDNDKGLAYETLIQRFREVVCRTVPPDATVVVVSKGDSELLHLENRRAWHFPQREDGVYAGYYPHNSSAAIAHLEALRARGAEFLVFPAPAFWWLSHYQGFTQHLESLYRVIAREDDSCLAFALREPPSEPQKFTEQNIPAVPQQLIQPAKLVDDGLPDDTRSELSEYVEGHLLEDLKVVFDPVYYSAQVGREFASFDSAVLHYVETGACQGFNPHPLFDTKYYLNAYPAVKQSGANPLLHFLSHSVSGGRNPSPLFDTEFYYSQSHELRAQGINALVHYLTNSVARTAHNPNPLFSNRYYEDKYRDVRDGNWSPLAHFVCHGCEEWRFASHVHHSIVSSLLRTVRQSLRRGNWTNGIVLIVCSGDDQAESALMLEVAKLLTSTYRLSSVVVFFRRRHLDAERERLAPVLVLEDFQLACEIFRPSALRLLAQTLHSMKPLFALCDAKDMIEPLAASGVPFYFLCPELACLDSKRALAGIVDRASRLLFDSSADFHSVAKKVGFYPTNVALRPRPRVWKELNETARASAREDLSQKLGIAHDRFVVLGLGTKALDHGFELFAGVAELFRSRDPERAVAFLWAATDDLESLPLQNGHSLAGDIERRGLNGVLYHLDQQASFEELFCAADAVLLSCCEPQLSDFVSLAMTARLPAIRIDEQPCRSQDPHSDTSVLYCQGSDDACETIAALAEVASRKRVDVAGTADERPTVAAYVSSLMTLAKRDFRLPESVSTTTVRNRSTPTRTIMIPCCDWAVSGVNSSLEAIGCELLRLGWDVQILFTRDRETILETAGDESHLPQIPCRYLDPSAPGFEGMWEALISDLENHAPCIMFMGYDFAANSIAAALSDNVAAVSWLQADDGDYYEQAYRLGRYCNAVVCVSAHIKQRLLELNPLIAARAEIIHNASVKTEQIVAQKPPPSGTMRLVYTGRLVQYQKRVLDFVELAHSLDRTGVSYQITLIGEYKKHEDIREMFETRAKSHLESGKIIVAGKMSRPKLLEELTNHDLFVLLSDFEGLPLALMEAMARGCVPVVAEMESGIPEVITTGVNGLTISGRDYDDWAARICELWHNQDSLRKMSRMACDTVRRQFTVEQVAKQFDELFKRIAQEIASPGFQRPVCLNWGDKRSPTGDVLPPPSFYRPFLHGPLRRG